MPENHWIIIGSGPTGVSAAHALVSRGQKVTLIDGGSQLDNETESVVSALGNLKYDDWDASTIESIKRKTAVNSSGIPRKKIFGSEFPFDRTGIPWDFKPSNVGCYPSFAEGGLSNVWGAAVLPVRQSEIKDWPITREDLAPHYEAVETFMPVSGTSHDLIDWFSLNPKIENRSRLNLGQQALRLIDDLDRSQHSLHQAGFHYGQSRLAVDDKKCSHCSFCMYGCPYGLIYKSTSTLNTLEKTGLLTRIKGLAVESVFENKDNVQLNAIDRKSGAKTTVHGSRLFIACGPIETTRLLLGLTAIDARKIILRDNHYFLFPWIRYRSTPGVKKERLHTLSQLFFEIKDPELSQYSVHVQGYSYNDLFPRALKSVAFGLGAALQPFDSILFSRFWMLQAYFHSHESPGIRVRMHKKSDGKESLELVTEPQTEFQKTRQGAVLRFFRRNSKFFKATPVGFMARAGLAGSGNHLGASFPMSLNPTEGYSDLLGRPHGFSRIHAVDSAVLPSIPATTITYTVMANAHRIATAALEKFGRDGEPT